MKKRLSFWFVTGGLLVGVVIAFAREWREWLELQTDMAATSARVADGASVRAENERLRQDQISPDELARLRGDHAALPRLRAELDALTSDVRAANETAAR